MDGLVLWGWDCMPLTVFYTPPLLMTLGWGVGLYITTILYPSPTIDTCLRALLWADCTLGVGTLVGFRRSNVTTL